MWLQFPCGGGWLVWWWVDAVYAAGAEAFGGAGFIRLVGAQAQEQFLEEGTRVVSPSPEEDIRAVFGYSVKKF